MLPEQLTTERLLLTPPNLADAVTIIELANDPLIAEMTLSVPSPYGEADAVFFLNLVNAGRSSGSAFIYAIRAPADRTFMGAIGLHMIEKYGHAELGYWMGKPFRGRGYVSEAVGALISASFTHTELARIQAIHKAGNEASGGALRHNGMLREGTLDDYVMKNGTPQTVISYRILRREWAERHNQNAD